MSDATRASQAPEDWDRSESDIIDASQASGSPSGRVAFPSHGQAEENGDGVVEGDGSQRGKRTLSELLKLHAAKGSDSNFSAEEATRVADVLGEWVSALFLYVTKICCIYFGRGWCSSAILLFEWQY